jgi:transcriptional regulator with XRE-family HTH domain
MVFFPEFNYCLGAVIRANRKRVAISQMLLAERAGVTRRFIQELENGRSNVSLQTLFALSRALETSLAEICSQIESAIQNGKHEG